MSPLEDEAAPSPFDDPVTTAWAVEILWRGYRRYLNEQRAEKEADDVAA